MRLIPIFLPCLMLLASCKSTQIKQDIPKPPRTNAKPASGAMQAKLDSMPTYGKTYRHKRFGGGIWFDFPNAQKVTKALKELPIAREELYKMSLAVINYEEMLTNTEAVYEFMIENSDLHKKKRNHDILTAVGISGGAGILIGGVIVVLIQNAVK